MPGCRRQRPTRPATFPPLARTARRLASELVGAELMKPEVPSEDIADRPHLGLVAQRLRTGDHIVPARVSLLGQRAHGDGGNVAVVDWCCLDRTIRPTDDIARLDLRCPPEDRVRSEHPGPNDCRRTRRVRDQPIDIPMEIRQRVGLLEERVRRLVRRRQKDNALDSPRESCDDVGRGRGWRRAALFGVTERRLHARDARWPQSSGLVPNLTKPFSVRTRVFESSKANRQHNGGSPVVALGYELATSNRST